MLPLPAPAPAAAEPADVLAALMRFPLEKWIGAPAAAGHVEEVGLPREMLRQVIRTGRRRGVLRTRREDDAVGFYVMRVDTPRRKAAPSA